MFTYTASGWGHLITWNGPMMGHLNSFSASWGRNLNKNFPKIQMPGGLPGGGMFKLRFDWYINYTSRSMYQVPLLNPLRLSPWLWCFYIAMFFFQQWLSGADLQTAELGKGSSSVWLKSVTDTHNTMIVSSAILHSLRFKSLPRILYL